MSAPRIPRTVPLPQRKHRIGMSAGHLAAVRALPCLICGRNPVDPHHLLRGIPPSERGTGRRASDQWAVPLCRSCHISLHARGNDDEFFAEHMIDGRAVARALWAARGDGKAMLRIVERNRR